MCRIFSPMFLFEEVVPHQGVPEEDCRCERQVGEGEKDEDTGAIKQSQKDKQSPVGEVCGENQTSFWPHGLDKGASGEASIHE